MLTIGEFARVGHVSSHLLRHYDRLGLLKPAHIDPQTSYRYYTLDQLPRLNRIIGLKHFGLSLKDVARVLDSDAAEAELHAMLRSHEQTLQRQIDAERQRLRELRTRLLLDEQDETPPALDVVIKPVPRLLVASYRTIIPSGAYIRDLFYAVAATLKTRGIRWGDAIGLYHLDSHTGHYPETGVAFTLADGHAVTCGELPGNCRQDLEACFVMSRPLKRPIPFRDGHITTRYLPAESYIASIAYHGTMRMRDRAGEVFMQWIAETGYRVRSPLREVYLRDDNRDDDDPTNIVDMQFPLVRLSE